MPREAEAKIVEEYKKHRAERITRRINGAGFVQVSVELAANLSVANNFSPVAFFFLATSGDRASRGEWPGEEFPIRGSGKRLRIS